MKITIERAALLKALGHVQSVVERRNTIPILSNVLLSATRDQVTFSATDLDMEIIDEGLAQVDTPGQITAPANTLYEIVRKLPEGADVQLVYSGEDPRLQVVAGRSKFNLPVLPAGDFPVMSSEGLSGFVIEPTDLARLIDKTRFAISTEETRYYLNGLYLHTVTEGGETKLRAVATDGHRLALAEMPAPEGAAGAPGVIIPRKTVQEARRLIEDAAGAIDLQVSPQKIRFEFGQATALTSKVIDGSFPDYLRVIPRDNPKSMLVDNELFAKAVDRVATISAEKSRSVKMAVEPGRLLLTVRNMEAGQGVEELEIDYDGDSFEIGFNARYLLDVTGQIRGENAEFRFADPASPTLVLDPADAAVKYVLMPLRV
ncbi:MAG: DNA polymerase III subunit beta [Caulobacterales bacterium 68-7]|nr:DNA polymerase III subunit beta [Caulobacterales bacterium]OJU12723.1 MAG: DNA polymerase III subunit beta [Caulobacterales bacterium 68-7]